MLVDFLMTYDMVDPTCEFDENEFDKKRRQIHTDVEVMLARKLAHKAEEHYRRVGEQFVCRNRTENGVKCTYKTPNIRYMRSHLLSCCGIKHVCPVCGRQITKTSEFNTHVANHKRPNNFFANVDSQIRKITFDDSYFQRPVLYLHMFNWMNTKNEPVGVSIGFSEFSDPVVWASKVIQNLKEKLEAMLAQLPNSKKIKYSTEPKHYCASAFYCYYILKWMPNVSGARSLDVAAAGRSTANSLKGFYRRLFDAVHVTADINELGYRNAAEHHFYEIAEKADLHPAMKMAMENNIQNIDGRYQLKKTVFNK